MLKDFVSAGRPRRGQWVKVKVGDTTFLAIVDGADHGLYGTRESALLKGEVEILRLPTAIEISANRALPHDDPKKRRGRPGWYGISVLALGSRDTAFHVLVEGDRLTPVVTRAEIVAGIGREKNADGEYVLAPGYVPRP